MNRASRRLQHRCLASALVACLASGGVGAASRPASRPVDRPHDLHCTGVAFDGAAAAVGATDETDRGTVVTAIAGPEIATGFASKSAVSAPHVMAVTANPIASRAACDVLADGGDAVDAAIVAQMVLNLVEPQSSGIGGGAFLQYYDAAHGSVQSYDGRETAPAAATENYLRWIDDATDRTTPRPNARASGRSIGVPGVLRMLELAHREHGRRPWRSLFDPAIAVATRGFAISPRMAASIAGERNGLARDAEAAAYFLNADGSPKTAGTLLKSPALARTFAALARGGADAFYRGEIARAIVDKVADRGGVAAIGGPGVITPGRMTLADLAGYRARHRDPVCTTYRRYQVCGMGPPSSGGIAVASALGILERFDLASHAPTSVDRDGGKPDVGGVHLVVEAERLAYADRDKYVADTDFVPLPGGSPAALLDPDYLASRAQLISPTRSMGRAVAGDFGPVPLGVANSEEHGTTQMTIGDRYGNVVSMTTTVESGFGSFHFVRGFLLNNQLTDFSTNPVDADGHPIANRVAGGKRPRSAMDPTLVFERAPDGGRGAFVLATGSAGGFVIIQFVLKTLVGVLDWGLDPQQAVSMVDFGAANSPTTYVGGEHPDVDVSDGGVHDPLVTGLRALGHTVSLAPMSSGLAALMRVVVGGKPAWVGGAEPRREYRAIGDAVGP